MGDMHDHDDRFAAGEHLEGEGEWSLPVPPPVDGKGPRPNKVRPLGRTQVESTWQGIPPDEVRPHPIDDLPSGHLGTIRQDPSKPRRKPVYRTALGMTRWMSAMFLLACTLWVYTVGTIWQLITDMTWERFFNYMDIVFEYALIISPLMFIVIGGWFGLLYLFSTIWGRK
jgi:hypothetical protein